MSGIGSHNLRAVLCPCLSRTFNIANIMLCHAFLELQQTHPPSHSSILLPPKPFMSPNHKIQNPLIPTKPTSSPHSKNTSNNNNAHRYQYQRYLTTSRWVRPTSNCVQETELKCGSHTGEVSMFLRGGNGIELRVLGLKWWSSGSWVVTLERSFLMSWLGWVVYRYTGAHFDGNDVPGHPVWRVP